MRLKTVFWFVRITRTPSSTRNLETKEMRAGRCSQNLERDFRDGIRIHSMSSVFAPKTNQALKIFPSCTSYMAIISS